MHEVSVRDCVIADTLDAALIEIREAADIGADVLELRVDFLKDMDLYDPAPSLKRLLEGCEAAGLPAIVTFRPAWETGQYTGPEPPRLAALKTAAELGAQYVDVEYLAAEPFFASHGKVPSSTQLILSHHDYTETPSDEVLEAFVEGMFQSGADIAKLATMPQRIEHSARMLALPSKFAGRRVIALAMGEKGLASRILAPKFGSFLTFGALSPSRISAPGQPTVTQLRRVYRLENQSAATQDAEQAGCITASGLEMFVGQEAEQFELFTGKPAPVELMRQATLESMRSARH
ncbi:3-dehydroquinate dehydratase [Coccomyxa sp. Obi]|nr:3-dehydroquinate dehydratase [Coccomyxa sp. Obi]